MNNRIDLWLGSNGFRFNERFKNRIKYLFSISNRKFDSKSDKDILLGYSTKSKAYKCLNKVTDKVIESANVRIHEFADKNDREKKREPYDCKKIV